MSNSVGVALGLFAEDVSFSYAPLLNEIAALGATHVSLIVPLYRAMRPRPRSSCTRDSRPPWKLSRMPFGLRAGPAWRSLCSPSCGCPSRAAPKEWRGTLVPADRDAWFASYGGLLADLASLGALTGASRLVVGRRVFVAGRRPCALATPGRTHPRHFSGTLMYSANWDHYQDVRLYELVDEIGVVAYFNLREPDGPSDVPALTERWRSLRREIEFSLAAYQKPFRVQRIGLPLADCSTAAPWDEVQGGVPDVG